VFELRHLRYFVAVAEELHFGRAAARLRIAQPPLSQQIRRLEASLGVELLRRTRRRVELTDAGRLLLEGARPLLAQAEALERAMARAARGDIGRLGVGFVGSVTQDVLPTLLRGFRDRHPEVAVTLSELSTLEQIEALRERRIGAGLLRPPVGDPAVATMPLLEEPLVAALPDFHRLARRRTVSIAALAAEPFVLIGREVNPAFHDDVVSACRAAGFSPDVVQEAGEMQTIASVVAAGIGVSLVPASVERLRREGDGVAYRPLRPSSVRLVVALAWRPADADPVVENLVGVARELWPPGRRGAQSRPTRSQTSSAVRSSP
jgi:DNA-binding transcriptional LysR family regulator